MWILKFAQCLFHGHAFADLRTSREPYKYCLHCGKLSRRLLPF